MRPFYLTIISLALMLGFSNCDLDLMQGEECPYEDVPSYSSASTNYIDLEDGDAYFQSLIKRDEDQENPGHQNYYFRMYNYSVKKCAGQDAIGFYNVELVEGDTTFFPEVNSAGDTTRYRYTDMEGDVIYHKYYGMPHSEFPTWLYIEWINEDTTEITGQFQAVVRDPEGTLDEKQRPDTVYFRDGYFRADLLKHSE